MEHHTTYLGQLRLDPPLSDAELDWLRSFAEWGGGPTGDPFDVPMNPRAELADGAGWGGYPDGRDRPRTGIPGGVRDWVPCDQGCHLMWRPAPCSNDALLALRFLVDHYLGPRALARGRGPVFDDFTFDHRVDGVLAGHRDDTEELFLLRAEDGRFHRETLDPGVARWPGEGSSDGGGGADDGDAGEPPWAVDEGTVAVASRGAREGTVRDLVRARRLRGEPRGEPTGGARRGPGRPDG